MKSLHFSLVLSALLMVQSLPAHATTSASAVLTYPQLRSDVDKGNADAQCALGVCYDTNGQGVKRNYAEAVKWYRLVATPVDGERHDDY